MWLKRDAQVAAVLRDLITAGEWGDRLPGYRKLEQRLKVDRETIGKALRTLETEGLLAPAEPGKRRRILHLTAPARATEPRTLLFVAGRPVHEFSPSFRSIATGIFQGAESQGWKVITHHFSFDHPRRAVTALKQSVSDHSPTRLIVMTPSKQLVRWMLDAPLPVYALGGEVWTVLDRISGSGTSFSGMVCAAAALLGELGHQRILIPMVTGKTQMRERTLAESMAGWAREIPRVELEAMLPEQGEWLPDVLKGFWPKQFARLQPTAVIVKESNELLSLLSYCQRAGLRVPEDLSVFELVGDPSSLWLDPVPDRFELPHAAVCRKALQWLEHPPAKANGFEFLEPIYLKGATMAPPRGG